MYVPSPSSPSSDTQGRLMMVTPKRLSQPFPALRLVQSVSPVPRSGLFCVGTDRSGVMGWLAAELGVLVNNLFWGASERGLLLLLRVAGLEAVVPDPSPLTPLFLFFVQNDIYEWSRDHRVHHKYSETDADPHNARRGFFFSHIGWLFVRKHRDVIEKGRKLDFTDLLEDPVVRFQRKWVWALGPVCKDPPAWWSGCGSFSFFSIPATLVAGAGMPFLWPPLFPCGCRWLSLQALWHKQWALSLCFCFPKKPGLVMKTAVAEVAQILAFFFDHRRKLYNH